MNYFKLKYFSIRDWGEKGDANYTSTEFSCARLSYRYYTFPSLFIQNFSLSLSICLFIFSLSLLIMFSSHIKNKGISYSLALPFFPLTLLLSAFPFLQYNNNIFFSLSIHIFFFLANFSPFFVFLSSSTFLYLSFRFLSLALSHMHYSSSSLIILIYWLVAWDTCNVFFFPRLFVSSICPDARKLCHISTNFYRQ